MAYDSTNAPRAWQAWLILSGWVLLLGAAAAGALLIMWRLDGRQRSGTIRPNRTPRDRVVQPSDTGGRPPSGTPQRITPEKHLIYGTWTIAAATIGLSLLSFCGLQDSRKTADIQAGLTRQSNRINREAFTAVQRAFVTVRDVKIENVLGPDGKTAFWSLTPIIQNSGNTPTKNLNFMIMQTIPIGGIFTFGPNKGDKPTFHATGEICQEPGDPDEHLSLMPKPGVGHAPLGPHVELPVSVIPGLNIGINLLRAIAAKQELYYISGVFHYDDIFPGSPPHETKFCYQLIAVTPVNGGIRPEYRLCQHWNCADDECVRDRDDEQIERGDAGCLPD
jgi:hypothetical protein